MTLQNNSNGHRSKILDGEPVLSHPVTRLISLGMSCECAYQLRRFTGIETASYFDWLGTPHQGLVKALRDGLHNCFRLANLAVSDEGRTVRDISTMISYRHNFPRIPGTDQIDVDLIRENYYYQWEKMSALAERWTETLSSEHILFVRQADTIREEIIELYDVLAAQAGIRDFALLIVIPRDSTLYIEHPKIYVEQLEATKARRHSWSGVDSAWDTILHKYWHPIAHSEMQTSKDSVPRSRSRKTVRLTEQVSHRPLVLFQPSAKAGTAGIYRLASLAMELQIHAQHYRTLFLMEGMDNGLLEALSLPCVHLPTHASVHHRATWRDWPLHEKRNTAKAAAVGVLQAVMPKLIVYDTLPSVFVMHAASAAGIRGVLLISNSVDESTYLESPRTAKFLAGGGTLLAPYSTPLPGKLSWNAEQMRFTGRLVMPIPSVLGATQAPKCQPQKRRIIVLAIGTLPAALDFIRTCIAATTRIADEDPLLESMLIVDASFRDIIDLHPLGNVTISAFDGTFAHQISSAVLVITSLDYCAISEVSRAGVDTICFISNAQLRLSSNELLRMEAAASSNITLISEYTEYSIYRSARQLIAKQRSFHSTLSVDGTTATARYLIQLAESTLPATVRPPSDGLLSQY